MRTHSLVLAENQDGKLQSGFIPMPSELAYAAGHYAEQVMPLEIVRPAPASAVIGFYSPDYYGYVGRETQIRITAQGGRYPYNVVIEEAPAGAVVSNDATDKDNYMVMRFTPTENGVQTIKYRVYDATGTDVKTITQTFTTSDDWCVFADPSGSDATGDGSFSNPYKTPQGALSATSGGKALILKNGNYTDTTLGISLSSATINSLLAWESRGAEIDMAANVQTTPGILFYINSSHTLIQGIKFSNPQNLVQSPRIFSGDGAVNYVYQDDCEFEINGAQTRCEFSGFVGLSNGWSAFDWYGTSYWAVECNTIRDQLSANNLGAGMLWPKGTGCKNGDIKNNEFSTEFSGSLIDIYMANVGDANDVSGNIDVSFNLIRASDNAGVWIARASQNGDRLPVWTRRNTLVGGCILIFRRSFDVTVHSDSDVLQSTISSSDPWKVVLRDSNDASGVYRPLSDMATLTASVVNYECQASSSVVDSSGILIGGYAAYRGTRGHEITRG